MLTVKAVASGASLRATIGSSRRRLACSSVIGVQRMPLVWRTMKATFSTVALAAAMMRSPSFSRSSSSTTTTSSPSATAWMASSTASNGADAPGAPEVGKVVGFPEVVD